VKLLVATTPPVDSVAVAVIVTVDRARRRLNAWRSLTGTSPLPASSYVRSPFAITVRPWRHVTTTRPWDRATSFWS
jgi:hypothetical protein